MIGGRLCLRRRRLAGHARREGTAGRLRHQVAQGRRQGRPGAHHARLRNGRRQHLGKTIAKLALKKLAPSDEFGVIQWNGTTTWHIKLQEIGDKRDELSRKIDRMTPSDMPEFDTGLNMAFKELTDPARNLATKHIIIISDGDPGTAARKGCCKS